MLTAAALIFLAAMVFLVVILLAEVIAGNSCQDALIHVIKRIDICLHKAYTDIMNCREESGVIVMTRTNSYSSNAHPTTMVTL